MIKIIDSNFELFDEFKDFCKIDSFGTRIYSHFLSYGYEFDFVDFWVQVNEYGAVTVAICKLDGDFVLQLSSDSDFDEISMFLGFQDKLSVTLDYKFNKNLNLDYSFCSCGDILTYMGNGKTVLNYKRIIPELKEYYTLLSLCKSEDFYVPDYLNFLSDVTRRINRNLCNISGVVEGDKLVSCAMTVSQTDFSVILGAVATHPDYRKKGYAGCIVKNLAEEFSGSKNVYIYTTVERNTRFYESIGFEVSGKWIKYTYGG